ncbi:MAG: Rne/Rng family ribonuclease [Oscillatoriales cyanobacterium SM2_2_1]|nr:Rne/Rng family ribonuclease [Oscillatoriales cyanobacterium SM2_2_1]
MPKQIIIAEQHRIAAVFSEDQIEEIVVATGTHQVGDVYLGVVENVLSSIDAAFVNIGEGDRNGFIHVTDLGPARLRRTGGSIQELVAPKQRILVQVMKEPTGNKGPRLTGNISLPGRYVVLLPYGKGVNLSRRIRDEDERNRLKALAILIKPSGMGLLVRTEAEDMSEDQIIEDLDQLQRQWELIQQESGTARHPGLLNRDQDFVQRILRDLYTDGVNRVVVDSSDGLRRIKQCLANWGEGKIPTSLAIEQHREPKPILEFFRVNAAIREALRPRVDLPSGGYIIIEPTEALTVIDVNSGSFTKSKTSRETVLWTNCEAAVEVARQLRLRNIAGVIVVDFIDMDSLQDKQQLLEQFNRALRADKSRPQIAQLTELGLVELTRKRQGQSLYELFGQPCPTCNGLGHLARLPGEAPSQPVDTTSRIWEYTSDDLDLEHPEVGSGLAGGLEANVLPHPSYQESKNGRRRRRDRNDRSDRNERGDRNGRSVSKLPPVPSLRTSEPTSEPMAAAVATPVSVPTERQTKRENPRPKPVPPEVVVVEMTEDEQDVYATMGISPLLLAKQEIKDPRNVIISVTLPGVPPRVVPVPSVPESTAEEESLPEMASSPGFEAPPEPAPPVAESEFVPTTSSDPLSVVVEQVQLPRSPDASRRKRSTMRSS